MKVFISWSGERSRLVAESLRYWLPKVIQAVQPWMSVSDIEKGTRWRTDIANELEQTTIGIICLTQENLSSAWIHFEAGALSKQQQNTYVCTFLYGLEPADIREPLAQFQTTRAKKDDIRKLIQTINNALGERKLPESEISESFDVWWPKLEERLDNISAPIENSEPQRKEREILEEILGLVRAQVRDSQSTFVRPKVRPRLITTLDCTPEDAQLLTQHYDHVVALAHPEDFNYILKLRSDKDFAQMVITVLKDFVREFIVADPRLADPRLVEGRIRYMEQTQSNENSNS